MPRMIRRAIQMAAMAAILAVGIPEAGAVFEMEPNDSPSDFGVINFSIGTNLDGDFDDGFPFQDDFWEFNITVGQTFRFQGTFINCSGLDPADMFLVIVDSSLNFYAFSDSTGDCGQETIIFTPSSSGTYYLWVYEATGTPTSGITDYRILTSNLTPATPSNTPSPSRTPTPSPSQSASPSPSPTPLQNQGTGRDVPTWEIGDYWDFTRTFSLDLELSQLLSEAVGLPIDADATIDVTDTYRLTVTGIQDEMTTISGVPVPQRVYVRERSNGLATGTGTLLIGGVPFATLDFPTTGALANDGEVWTRVSDLGEAHENFHFIATLDATFVTTGNPSLDLAIFDIALNLDHDPPLETGDFPFDLPGEQWINTPTRRIHGDIFVDFPVLGSSVVGMINIPIIGNVAAPPDENFGLDRSSTFQKSDFYVGPDAPRQGYNPSYHNTNGIAPPFSENYWYAPGAEEFVERQLPTIQLTDSGDSVTAVVRNFTTVVDPGSAVVQPETILNIVFMPFRPATSGAVTLSGQISPAPPAGTSVFATIVDTGAMGGGMTNGSGNFSIPLVAPPSDDFSPASEDGGSFGVEITVQGFPDRKVASLQLDGAGITPVMTWEAYE